MKTLGVVFSEQERDEFVKEHTPREYVLMSQVPQNIWEMGIIKQSGEFELNGKQFQIIQGWDRQGKPIVGEICGRPLFADKSTFEMMPLAWHKENRWKNVKDVYEYERDKWDMWVRKGEIPEDVRRAVESAE